ncbi:bifunctional ADP-dependent NAD(P)H-hydrate dehydratase/NAD(P)H-hydrate epimerase [Treponema sp. C6A8]|uniref:bifunctional ADP-dependent NAD(P)H-hydrate dehydratase/NAD(P)H-hydrate epimerase n=1 Tax=Treponema sp. C6A8 TaxID=1410609 RepID=UPI0004809A65|nr:bifunctional ADP-dependent NAD(P)H-hydrate dehydratase/NAD(P)H-hydrate epimerase [Treponema sp. C6A8]
MKAIFTNSQDLEKSAKEKFLFPPFLMMENAAAGMEASVMEVLRQNESAVNAGAKSAVNARPCKILIVCGSGNNGGDGYALARRISGKAEVECTLIALSQPKTEEAIHQRQMAEAAGISVLTEADFWALEKTEGLSDFSVIVDCILGTGFTGQLRENIAYIVEKLNELPAYKIACDIPTGLRFKADTTITMGCLKTALFSDRAKAVCGKIIIAGLGISREKFESCGNPDAFLIEESDIKLPLRKNKAAHKGTFGHTAVFAGEKSGAGILAATAALNFGSGLVTLVKSQNSNLAQFKISPELMISDQIPANTSCVLIGSGLGFGAAADKALQKVFDWYKNAKSAACVLDADLFSNKKLFEILQTLSALQPQGKIILTPHLKELKNLYQAIFPEKEISVEELTFAERRIEIGKEITAKFPNLTVIMKSANTFIANGGQTYICDRGTQSLAKAGSGDVLAGMAAALLAQGYTALDAAITAVYAHALAGSSFANGEDWGLTAEKLINRLGK